eukprot:1596880-Karenia_brevis.AAC.1
MAISTLNLNSDHRCVATWLELECSQRKFRRSRQLKWNPILDHEGKAVQYQEKLNNELQYTALSTMEDLERVITDAAYTESSCKWMGEKRP